MVSNQQKRSFLVISLGVAFEHLDMMLVTLMASSIVEEFVGHGGSASTMLYAYMGYAIAFLFRPLGAFSFGCVADLYGRKIALVGSTALMSVATLGLAFIPGVEVLGGGATLLFLMCRIAQGLAVGGEYGTAITYSYEMNSRWRTFCGACVVSSSHIGGVCASVLASLYVGNFRTTFLVGGVVGCFLLLLRSFIKEYHLPVAKKVLEVVSESVKDSRAIFEVLVIASMLVFVFYGSLIYLNELVHHDLGIPRSEIFSANALLLALWIILPPCLGYIVDRFDLSYRKMMRVGALGVLLSAPLLGLALVFSSYSAVLVSQILMHIFHMMFSLCTPRFFGDLFAAKARNTSISTCYSLGASSTAALTPVVCHMTIVLFHTNFAICMPFILIAMMAIFILKKEEVCKKGTLLNSMT